MNVDEAMEEARQFGEQESKDMLFAEHIAILLATEVERLREALFEMQQAAIRLVGHIDEAKAELAEAKAEIVGLEEGHDRLAAELAEAKAASACPVELVALGDADWECSVGVKCKSSEDADRLYNWLRDRTKDKTPPEA